MKIIYVEDRTDHFLGFYSASIYLVPAQRFQTGINMHWFILQLNHYICYIREFSCTLYGIWSITNNRIFYCCDMVYKYDAEPYKNRSLRNERWKI